MNLLHAQSCQRVVSRGGQLLSISEDPASACLRMPHPVRCCPPDSTCLTLGLRYLHGHPGWSGLAWLSYLGLGLLLGKSDVCGNHMMLRRFSLSINLEYVQ